MDNHIFGILKMVLERTRCIKDDFQELGSDDKFHEFLGGNAYYIDLMLCNADIDILVNHILEDLENAS